MISLYKHIYIYIIFNFLHAHMYKNMHMQTHIIYTHKTTLVCVNKHKHILFDQSLIWKERERERGHKVNIITNYEKGVSAKKLELENKSELWKHKNRTQSGAADLTTAPPCRWECWLSLWKSFIESLCSCFPVNTNWKEKKKTQFMKLEIIVTSERRDKMHHEPRTQTGGDCTRSQRTAPPPHPTTPL